MKNFYKTKKKEINLDNFSKKINFKEFKINTLIKKINIKKYYESINLKPYIEKIKNNKIIIENYYSKLNPTIWINGLQDQLDKLITNDSNDVVLKQSKFWAQAITWSLISGTTFFFGWFSLAKTDEIVIALGRLEPSSGVIDVQMPLEGIAREILVKEGDRVVKGQTLIRLDTEITEAKSSALKQKLEINATILSKLDNLVKEGAVSELQYLEQKAKIEDLKSQIKTNQVMQRYQEILSPVNGLIFELQPKGPGYVAKSSQPVLQVVPEDNLIARVEIDNRTIGFVKVGNKAEISIDSFPATDFGVIEGTLVSIGSDALPPITAEGKGYRFPAKIELRDQFLQLKSGEKLKLQAGMSLNANIKLRKRTYLQILLNKFSDKTDSLKSK